MKTKLPQHFQNLIKEKQNYILSCQPLKVHNYSELTVINCSYGAARGVFLRRREKLTSH